MAKKHGDEERGISTSLSSSQIKPESGLAARIRTAIGTQSVNKFAVNAEIGESLLRQYLGGSMPGADKLVRIARTAGVSVEWLATGDGEMRPGGGPVVQMDDGQEGEEGAVISVPAAGGEAQSEGLDGGSLAVLELDVRVSAGDGEMVLEELPNGEFHFDARYFKGEIGIEPSQARVVRVMGDSMEPTFRAGDPILVCVSKDQPYADGIWVLSWGNAVHVKRCQFRGRELKAMSDNPSYEPMHFDLSEDQPDFHLVGRVVWSPRLH